MLSCLVRHHICEIVSCCPVWLDNIYVNYAPPCREKDKTVVWEYNVMQTPLHGGRSAPLPPFQIVFQRKITIQMGIQREPTTPIYHLRCLL